MSVFRIINGKNNNHDLLQRKYNYITDPVKTDGGSLVGTWSCLTGRDLKDWETVKRIYHKSGGKQGEHVCLSLTPDDKNNSDEHYMKIASKIADRIFAGHQCIYAVHKDSNLRHIHFLLNSVSFKTGLRWHTSKSDLANLRLNVNRILSDFNFDIITSKAEDMEDNTPYDVSEGFECLEIYEETEKVCTPVSVLVDDVDDIDKSSNEIKKFKFELFDDDVNNTDYKEENLMNNNNYNPNFGYYTTQPVYESTDSRSLPSVQHKQTAVTATQPQQPAEQDISLSAPLGIFDNGLPTLTFNLAPTINVTCDSNSSSPQKIADYINAINTKPDLSNGAKCGLAVISMAQKQDMNINVAVNTCPTINLNFVDGLADDND